MSNILIFSYYANLPGACQAEWIDDKIDAIKELNINFSIVTSPSAAKIELATNHYRAYSIGLKDFKDEFERCKVRKFSLFLMYIWFPIAFLIGGVFDLIQLIVTKGVGEGRWSWIITSFISGFVLILKEGRPNYIFSTGGPASAHVSAVLLGKLFDRKVIIELQDPLSGMDIGRNVRAKGFLFLLEKYLANNVYKLVYVTKSAQKFARKQFNTDNISYIYPGARPFIDKKPKATTKKLGKLTLIHLGSLYSSRNFDTLLLAFDKIFNKKLMSPNELELINLGHVSDEIMSKIQKFNFIKVLKPVSRLEALNIASKCDILVLIQNNDSRSSVTIPYKTYDYLNLSLPILGLTNSNEIDDILTRCGGAMVAQVNDIDEITKKIIKIVRFRKEVKTRSTINYIKQARVLLNVD